MTASTYRRQAAAFAASVSRNLREQSVTTLPSGTSRFREGVRVSGYSPRLAKVLVDIDRPNEARRLADVVVAALHRHGYRTDRLDDATIHVHRGGTAINSTDRRCHCMAEDPGDGLGERVVTHASTCWHHPEHDPQATS